MDPDPHQVRNDVRREVPGTVTAGSDGVRAPGVTRPPGLALVLVAQWAGAPRKIATGTPATGTKSDGPHVKSPQLRL